ncbi:MAG: type II secretion system protein GspC [Stenotrophobium sp.]
MFTLPHPSGKALALAYEQHSRWIVPAATALLVAAVACVAAQLVWALVPVPQAGQWRPAPAPAVIGTQTGPDLDKIIAARLFGLYQATVNPQDQQAAPDTQLNLTLLGIFAGTRKEDSRAVIAPQGGEEKPFAIGDDVVKGVNLQAIFPDRVILSRSGQLETLRLDRDKPNTGGGFVASNDSSPNLSAQLTQIRQQILQNPDKAAEFLRVQPAMSGSQMTGYRIYPGPNPAIFNGSGLHPGDLVTSVNGIQLDNTQKALQMLNDLSNASSVSLVVNRGGQQQTINVSFN